MRPAVGVGTDTMVRLNRDVLNAGYHLVKDDEVQVFADNRAFRQHVEAMVAARDEAQAHSGERKGYLANLICEADELAERWDIVKTLGVDGVLMSPVLQGFSTLSMLARERQMPILAHNTFSDLLTRHPVGHRASGAERPVRKPRRRLDRDLGRIRCWRWRRRC